MIQLTWFYLGNMTKKMCKIWELVKIGRCLAHSQIQTWEHFVAKCSQSQMKNVFYYDPKKT